MTRRELLLRSRRALPEVVSFIFSTIVPSPPPGISRKWEDSWDDLALVLNVWYHGRRRRHREQRRDRDYGARDVGGAGLEFRAPERSPGRQGASPGG